MEVHMIIRQCPLCHEKQLRIKKLECTACGVNFEGDFYSSPLLNLSAEQQRFIELFMLNSGSLKKMADSMGVTYPTIRTRLDAVIEALEQQIAKRDEYKNEILEQVNQGRLSPEKAAQIIKSL
jgi:hypothetical protein